MLSGAGVRAVDEPILAIDDAPVFGIWTSTAWRQLATTFETVYCYRGIFQLQRQSARRLPAHPIELGCVLRHFGGAWKVHGVRRGQQGAVFDEIAQWDAKPSSGEIAQLWKRS